MTKYYQCGQCKEKFALRRELWNHKCLRSKVEMAKQIDASSRVAEPWPMAQDMAINSVLADALKPMFSKRHYKRIAELLSQLPDESVRDIATAKFAAMLAEDNPAFLPVDFWDAVNRAQFRIKKGGK